MERMINDWVLSKDLAACSQIKHCQDSMYDITRPESHKIGEINLLQKFDEYLNTLTYPGKRFTQVQKRTYHHLNRKSFIGIAIRVHEKWPGFFFNPKQD